MERSVSAAPCRRCHPLKSFLPACEYVLVAAGFPDSLSKMGKCFSSAAIFWTSALSTVESCSNSLLFWRVHCLDRKTSSTTRLAVKPRSLAYALGRPTPTVSPCRMLLEICVGQDSGVAQGFCQACGIFRHDSISSQDRGPVFAEKLFSQMFLWTALEGALGDHL